MLCVGQTFITLTVLPHTPGQGKNCSRLKSMKPRRLLCVVVSLLHIYYHGCHYRAITDGWTPDHFVADMKQRAFYIVLFSSRIHILHQVMHLHNISVFLTLYLCCSQPIFLFFLSHRFSRCRGYPQSCSCAENGVRRNACNLFKCNCLCDITAGKCDFNCCCDPDCSTDQVGTNQNINYG